GSVGEDPRLCKPRSASLVKELGVVWPDVERRRGPRRRTAGDRILGRRVTDALLPDIDAAFDARALQGTVAGVEAVAPRVRDRHVRGYRRAVLVIDIFAAA